MKNAHNKHGPVGVIRQAVLANTLSGIDPPPLWNRSFRANWHITPYGVRYDRISAFIMAYLNWNGKGKPEKGDRKPGDQPNTNKLIYYEMTKHDIAESKIKMHKAIAGFVILYARHFQL